jgi:carboxypeptidase C (cathepsin A)
VSTELRKALVMNPQLRVLVCNGLFDLATPFFASEHTTDHLDLPDGLRDNVRHAYYEAGHMMYLHGPSHAKLRADLLEMYAGEASPKRSRRVRRGGG